MKTSERYPVTQGDVIVNYASSLFDRTELTTDKALPADVYCGDILDSKTFALYDSAAAVGEPVINLSICPPMDRIRPWLLWIATL